MKKSKEAFLDFFYFGLFRSKLDEPYYKNQPILCDEIDILKTCELTVNSRVKKVHQLL